MKQRRLLLSLLVPVALLAAAVAFLTWLFESEAGLHWAYRQLRDNVPGTLDVRTLTGKLAGPLTVDGLNFRSDAVELRVEHARLDWSPATLLVGRLQIDALALNDVDVALRDTGRSRDASHAPFQLPLNVDLSEFRLERLRVARTGAATVSVDVAELAGFLGQEIARVDRLSITAPTFAVNAHGSLGLRPAVDRSLQVQWQVDLPRVGWIKGSGEIGGNPSKLVLTQQIAEPIVASVRAEVRNPLEAPAWQLHVSAPVFDARRLRLIESEYQIGVALDAAGDLARYRTTGKLQLQVPELPPLAGEFALRGAIRGDDLELDQLTVQVLGTDMRAHATANWKPREATWTATLQWQHLRWPLAGDPAFESPQGALDASGTHTQYRGTLDLVTIAKQVPRAHWRAHASGDWNRVMLDDVDVDALGSTLHGSASVAWSPRFQWRTMLRGQELDPAGLWPDLPGSLAIQAAVAGDAEQWRVDVESLRGRLRGQDISAKGSLTRRGEDYPQIAAELTIGEASASVHGAIERQWDLDWQLRVPDLAALVSSAGGNVAGTGRVTGERTLPRIETQLSLAKLAYADVRVGAGSIEAAIDLSDRTASHAKLLATNSVLANRAFEHIALTANGFLSNHSVVADLRVAQVALSANLSGAYRDTTWSGTLSASTLRLGNENWSLAGEPKLSVSAQHWLLERSCWGKDRNQACVELNGTADASTIVALSTRELPLAVITSFFPNPPAWHGTVSGDASLRFDVKRLTRADARIDFSTGEIALTETAATVFAYDGAALRMTVDEHGLHANAKLSMAGGDGGTAELALPQFHADTDLDRQPVTGRMTFSMRDLAPVAALLPQLAELSGTLRMDFTVDGTLADPRVRGEAVLENAAARIPATGIRVHDVRLAATADGGDQLRLSGAALSGPGRLAVDGRVEFPDDRAWGAQINIAGERFQVADLREAQILVSPELNAKLAPGEISVTGSVRVPKAVITAAVPKGDVVKTSTDLVVVNAPAAEAAVPRWKVSAQIRVVLGEEITVSAFGLSAKLAGDLTLTDVPGQPTTGRGEVRVVAGEYEAYGEKLQVERGRLVLIGGPVTNPGIDARAVRKIDQITAGVEVKGTLQAPQLTLFSDPAMSQSDTLSYILFGSPFETSNANEDRYRAAARALKFAGGDVLAKSIGTEIGIEEVGISTGASDEAAALVLGKQLSPRLYINYSIGLFTPANVVFMRYKLNRNWSLEAQSGARAGGDITYTIEK